MAIRNVLKGMYGRDLFTQDHEEPDDRVMEIPPWKPGDFPEP